MASENSRHQLFDGKYTLDQALVLVKKSLGDNFSKTDLLKERSSDNTIEFHCYARKLPLLIELNETSYEAGIGTNAKPLGESPLVHRRGFYLSHATADSVF